MESKYTTSKIENQKQSKSTNSNNKLNNLESDYFIRKFFAYIPKRKSLKAIKYNKICKKDWI